jgi:hypothetical protein
MLEQVTLWLKDGDEHEAASLLVQCSLNLLYVDTLFDLGGEQEIDMFDVNIEAPRKVTKEIAASPALRNQIESAIRDCAQTSNGHIRHILWVPKFGAATTEMDEQISAALAKVDSEHVQKAWNKALVRKNTDPDGAITAARTLVESVCKHVLDNAGVQYPTEADLPKLYFLAAEQLQLAPSQYSDKVVRQILGNCQAVVNGIAALRNELGDAHGKGTTEVSPDAAHAELAVNLAGTIATFLISRWEKI